MPLGMETDYLFSVLVFERSIDNPGESSYVVKHSRFPLCFHYDETNNVLRVILQTTIYSLADRGWPQRRIARELGISREMVDRYLRLAEAKPAILTPGKIAQRRSHVLQI